MNLNKTRFEILSIIALGYAIFGIWGLIAGVMRLGLEMFWDEEDEE